MKKLPTKKTTIMDSINILDRIDILVMQNVPGHFNVTFECKEKGKRLVFDPKALATLKEKVNHLVQGKNANDPSVRGYIEEFVGRLIDKLHNVDLCAIEDLPDAPDDPYEKVRMLGK